MQSHTSMMYVSISYLHWKQTSQKHLLLRMYRNWNSGVQWTVRYHWVKNTVVKGVRLYAGIRKTEERWPFLSESLPLAASPHFLRYITHNRVTIRLRLTIWTKPVKRWKPVISQWILKDGVSSTVSTRIMRIRMQLLLPIYGSLIPERMQVIQRYTWIKWILMHLSLPIGKYCIRIWWCRTWSICIRTMFNCWKRMLPVRIKWLMNLQRRKLLILKSWKLHWLRCLLQQ